MTRLGLLNSRQQQILTYIKEFLNSKGYPPSVREIGDAVGLSSSSTVHGYLNKLEAMGFIKRDPTKPRAILVLDDTAFSKKQMVSVPLLGKVTAGIPITAIENVEDTYPLPIDFVGKSDTFLLVVQGDSMIDAGIFDGDYIVVQSQKTARNGEIVVAMLDNEVTVKRYYKEKNHIRLQPENMAYEPIISRDVSVVGKVIGLMRFMN